MDESAEVKRYAWWREGQREEARILFFFLFCLCALRTGEASSMKSYIYKRCIGVYVSRGDIRAPPTDQWRDTSVDLGVMHSPRGVEWGAERLQAMVFSSFV